MIEEKFEVCPHCNQEIREKSTFIDKDNYLYHSPCFEKGPIEHIKPMSSEELSKALGWGSKALRDIDPSEQDDAGFEVEEK